MLQLRSIGTFASLLAFAHALTHQLIIGTLGTKSLYTVEFDDEASTLKLLANTSVPVPGSWITLNHDNTKLYTNAWATGPQFASYSLSDNHEITHDVTIAAGGNCTATSIFVVANPNPPYSVYGSFFGSNGGCGSVLSVDENGVLDAAIQNYTLSSAAGVHGTALSSDSRFLYSADDSANALWTHSIDPETGKVTFVANLTALSTGADPRHVAVHPSGKFLYVVLEGSNEIAQYTIDQSTGIPSFENVIYPLISSGDNASSYLGGDEVALSSSNKHLWATTRGGMDGTAGYISVFTLDENGAIKSQNFLTHTSTSGGGSNAVAPSPSTDRYAALMDSSKGFVEIWELAEDASNATIVAHLDLADGGCCANAVWLS
ncbi:hypothetical protein PFICI_11300 [Pestalotiopsis fici W106-1]|uniref:Carboxy-cis,cis-muconate cyclase n=1 Tax=Pestalotiopsis fici (strain W106-1 / CGMCC3.15140) TaxID=1229662 RepID=W3WX30_PESFW|nr:uncharacterized protein PFICI_11300 [Pestalotiopsis fici W106-1]ETS77426.1 hypothetical protein PFICI_11300 [Pestalotiopsis fici W106-1]